MSRVSLDEILELPPAERVAVVQEIWESMVAKPDTVPITLAQREELERRWTAFQQDPDEGEPWDDVKASLRRE